MLGKCIIWLLIVRLNVPKKVLGINQETLRLWGGLRVVKEHKLRKSKTEHYQREAEYIRKADTVIEKLRLENHVVLREYGL